MMTAKAQKSTADIVHKKPSKKNSGRFTVMAGDRQFDETANSCLNDTRQFSIDLAQRKDITPSDKVYNFILDKILTREWPIRMKIMTEPELCEHLNVSRMAVREAVERLCGLGLLMKKQGSGTYVTEPRIDNCLRMMLPMSLNNPGDVKQLLDFRRYFEYGNVILYMQNSEPEDLLALEANYQEMIELHASDMERSSQLDFEFHQLIAKGTKNKFIAKISEFLIEIMRSHQAVLYYTHITQGNAIVYHNEIIRALKNGDGDVAAMLMRRHVDIAIECYEQSRVLVEGQRARRHRDDEIPPPSHHLHS